MIIPAISLWQPWASLWVYGEKTNETRSWPIPPRFKLPFRLAVHASKKWTLPLRAIVRTEPFRSSIMTIGKARMPLGELVGTVEIFECIRFTPAFVASLSEKELAFGDYAIGRYGWRARDFKPFKKPIPMTGRQGFFNVDIDPKLLEIAA